MLEVKLLPNLGKLIFSFANWETGLVFCLLWSLSGWVKDLTNLIWRLGRFFTTIYNGCMEILSNTYFSQICLKKAQMTGLPLSNQFIISRTIQCFYIQWKIFDRSIWPELVTGYIRLELNIILGQISGSRPKTRKGVHQSMDHSIKV